MSRIPTKDRKSPGRLKAWLTIASGPLFLISFMAVAAHFGALPGFGGLVSALWSIAVAICIAIVIRGRKMMAVDAATLLEHDKRPLILYLRPFSKDGQFPLQKGLARLRSKRRLKLQGWTIATYEEQVAHALRKVGPFVAIGDPKKPLPELGAARMWVDDPEWQGTVRDLVARAGLIFMQIGESEGFCWELDQVVKTADPHKLILGLPFAGKGGEKARQTQYENFRMKSLTVLPKPLVEKPADALFLYFDESWTPHLLVTYKWIQLPDHSPEGHSSGILQLKALKELHSEFMLVSTPYWVRGGVLMAIVMIVWVSMVFVALKYLFRP